MMDLITKIAELKNEAVELKNKLSEHNLPSSSKTFVEGENVYIGGTFRKQSTYAPNQFVFAAQAEHLETGEVDYVDMSQKTNITKKKSVYLDIRIGLLKLSGEYVLKLYVMDGKYNGCCIEKSYNKQYLC